MDIVIYIQSIHKPKLPKIPDMLFRVTISGISDLGCPAYMFADDIFYFADYTPHLNIIIPDEETKKAFYDYLSRENKALFKRTSHILLEKK